MAVTFNRTHYFIDKGRERGITYEALKSFEKDLNAHLKTGSLELHLVIVPMSRDQLHPALSTGKVNLMAAMDGKQYDLDYLLMAAQGYQESTLDHSVRSPSGAIGVMQVMPATGKQLGVGDIREIEANIHAGVKYMRFMMDEYFKDEPMDGLNKGLMAFAAYNAGPGRVRQLRRETQKRGLNANVWFGTVERLASERIGRETVTYVSNTYKYYVTYRLLSTQRERRAAAKASLEKGT